MPELTAREVDVLRLIADGLRTKEIAQRLALSIKTVEFYKTSIYAKIGANGTVDAVRFAVREGYINPSAHI